MKGNPVTLKTNHSFTRYWDIGAQTALLLFCSNPITSCVMSLRSYEAVLTEPAVLIIKTYDRICLRKLVRLVFMSWTLLGAALAAYFNSFSFSLCSASEASPCSVLGHACGVSSTGSHQDSCVLIQGADLLNPLLVKLAFSSLLYKFFQTSPAIKLPLKSGSCFPPL